MTQHFKLQKYEFINLKYELTTVNLIIQYMLR